MKLSCTFKGVAEPEQSFFTVTGWYFSDVNSTDWCLTSFPQRCTHRHNRVRTLGCQFFVPINIFQVSYLESGFFGQKFANIQGIWVSLMVCWWRRQMFTYFKISFVLISVQTECCKLELDPGSLWNIDMIFIEVRCWHLSARQAGGEQEGLQMAVELDDVQKEDELTLSAACRWSNTAPASARQWGYHQWSTTGTPPRTASHRLKEEKNRRT